MSKVTGESADWPEFFSVFQTLVDKDNHLRSVKKFQHSCSCLAESAYEMTESLEVSTKKYVEPIKLLNDR